MHPLRLITTPVALTAILNLTSSLFAQIEGPMTISNDHIRLTVNPSVGRIVDFGRIGRENLLRITDASVLTEGKEEVIGYQGYGGDQLWPAQQRTWGAIRGSGGTWPPLDELDGPNWQVIDQSPLHVTMQSPPTPLLGLVAERRIKISPDAAVVTIDNTFTRVAIPNPDKTFEVNIWSVTGVIEPEFVMTDIATDKPDGEQDWIRLSNNPSSIIEILPSNDALRFDNQRHGPGESLGSNAVKFGTYGDWLAAIYENDIFLQTNDYDPTGNFPDRASIEIYSSQNSGSEYLELEVLSTSVDLALGETLSNTVNWHLLERRAELSDAQLAAHLRSVPEPAGLASTVFAGFMMVGFGCRRRQATGTP